MFTLIHTCSFLIFLEIYVARMPERALNLVREASVSDGFTRDAW